MTHAKETEENTMRHLSHLLISLILFSCGGGLAHAADVKIIANPSIPVASISAAELQRIFLQTKSSLDDGTHVLPVLGKSGATHDAFLRTYLGKTDAALQTYYRTPVFTGKGSMPKVAGSDTEVISYVSGTKGAIGYVSAGAAAAGTKILEVR